MATTVNDTDGQENMLPDELVNVSASTQDIDMSKFKKEDIPYLVFDRDNGNFKLISPDRQGF